MATMRGRHALFASALALGAHACATVDGKSQKAEVDLRPADNSSVVSSAADDGLYRDAVAAISRRDYATALDVLQAARDRTPNDPRVLNAFGVVYDKLGRFDLSQRYYARAQTLDPGSAVVAHNLAYSQVLQGKAPAEAPVAFAAASPAQSPSPALRPALEPAQPLYATATPLEGPVVVLKPAAPLHRAAVAKADPKLLVAAPVWAADAPAALASVDAPSIPQPAAWTAIPVAPAQAVTANLAPLDRAAAVSARPEARTLSVLFASEAPPLAASLPATVPSTRIAQPAEPAVALTAAELQPFDALRIEPAAHVGRASALRAEPAVWHAPMLTAETAPAKAPAVAATEAAPVLYPANYVTASAPATIVAAPALVARPQPISLAFAPVATEAAPAPAATVAPQSIRAKPAPHPLRFAFFSRTLVKIAHVLHLPFADRFGPQPTILARTVPAKSPAPQIVAAASASVAGEDAGPALLGRPVLLVYSSGERSAALSLQRRLEANGWSVAMTGAASAAPRETTIRFEAAHARVARGLARSLDARVKLERCRATCDGVTLILGVSPIEDAKARGPAGRLG